MRQTILAYFMANSAAFWSAVREHVLISAASLAVALLIAVPGGYLCVRYGGLKKTLLAVFQTLRIVPSLAVLFCLSRSWARDSCPRPPRLCCWPYRPFC